MPSVTANLAIADLGTLGLDDLRAERRHDGQAELSSASASSGGRSAESDVGGCYQVVRAAQGSSGAEEPNKQARWARSMAHRIAPHAVCQSSWCSACGGCLGCIRFDSRSVYEASCQISLASLHSLRTPIPIAVLNH